MAGGTSQSDRRISAAIFKIEQFLLHLERIADAGFPHDDGRTALADIKKVFEDQKATINRIPVGVAPVLADEYFREVRDKVEAYTRVLGIILRSTNLRNSFEIYFPLKKIAKKFVGDKVRLLISSEWEFIPFTYPINFKEVPNLILVGSPATEAQNLLVTPLAGHEIGHSVWAHLGIVKKLEPFFKNAIAAYFVSGSVKMKKLEKDNEGLLLDLYKASIESCLQRKSEEIFCDLFGLWIFGASYMFAFEYYMAPGRSKVSPFYPSDFTRIQILKTFTGRLNISVPENLFLDWKEPGIQSGDNEIYEIADEILVNCERNIFDEVKELMGIADLESPNQERVSEILMCLDRFEPFSGSAEFPEIVNALWLAFTRMNLRTESDTKRLFGLTEIALKTVEVAEFYAKQKRKS